MRTGSTRWTTVIAAFALGAASMYVLDPDKGRRRRALGRDKVRRFVGNARTFATAAARDANHRLRGVRARFQRRLRREGIPDDLMLIERVRAQLGRGISHPHALQVGSNRGTVVLSGPILAHEVTALLAQVRAVPGVTRVEDHLAVYESAASIPSLQGQGAVRDGSHRWTPATRGAALVGGTVLALYGAQKRTAHGLVLTMIGALLAARGAARESLDDLAPHTAESPDAFSRTPSIDGQPAASGG
jgi:hypothetical protein